MLPLCILVIAGFQPARLSLNSAGRAYGAAGFFMGKVCPWVRACPAASTARRFGRILRWRSL